MQVSWIDPDELSRLAAELQSAAAPPDEGDEQGNLPGLSFLEDDGSVTLIPPFRKRPAEGADNTVGSASGGLVAPEIVHIREQLRQIRERAQQAGILSGNPNEPAPASAPDAPTATAPLSDAPAMRQEREPGIPGSAAHFLPLEGSMEERLDAFGRWVSRLVAGDELLLIDDRGEMIWSSGTRSDLTLTTLLAVTASLRSQALRLVEPPDIIRNKLSESRELSVLPCPTKHGLVSLAVVNAAGIPAETAAWLREALVLTVEGKSEETPPI